MKIRKKQLKVGLPLMRLYKSNYSLESKISAENFSRIRPRYKKINILKLLMKFQKSGGGVKKSIKNTFQWHLPVILTWNNNQKRPHFWCNHSVTCN